MEHVQWTSVCKIKESNKDSKWESKPEEKDNTRQTKKTTQQNTNKKVATANLDCVLADKASTWTMAKRKATEEKVKVTMSRKRTTFLSDSPTVAGRKIWGITTQTSLPKTGTAFSLIVLSMSWTQISKTRNHRMTFQTRTPKQI